MQPTKRRGRKPRVNTDVTIINSFDNPFKVEKGLYPIYERGGSNSSLAQKFFEVIKTLKPGSDEYVTITTSILENKRKAFNMILYIRRKVKEQNLNIILTPNTLVDTKGKYIGVRVWRKQ